MLVDWSRMGGRTLLDLESIRKWSNEKQVAERTVAAFWEALHHYRSDSPDDCRRFFGDIDDSNFAPSPTRISVQIDNYPACDYVCVVVWVPVVYQGRNLGLYKALFDLSGEIQDDFLGPDPDVLFGLYGHFKISGAPTE